jgi:predicted phage terminase large subunit-like protein
LHPEHESADVLLDLKKNMGSISFSAQYQQTPIPLGGTFIKSKWLKSHTSITFEPADSIVLSWDIALSEAQTGDYSAGVVLLNRGEKFFVLEVVRGRFQFPQLIDKIVEMCRRYPNGSLLIEDSPISKGLIQSIRNHDINVLTVTPDKDKQSRVISQSDLFEGGSISLPTRAEWRDTFVGELLAFPGGQHDDQVDALVQGLAWQRGRWLRTIKVRATTLY